MKKIKQTTIIFYIYCGISAMLFIMMKTVREIYRFDIAHFNALQIVLVGTTLEIVHLLFEVPTGVIADKVSRKLSIIIGLILIGVSILIEGLFPIFLIILIAQVILGIGDTFTSGADEAWVTDELNGEDVEMVFLKSTQVGQWFSIIGTVISVYFGYFNIRMPYFISGVLFIVLGIFLILFMDERYKPEEQSVNKFRHMKNSLIMDIVNIKKTPILLFMVFITFFHGLYSEGIDRLWTPHFIDEIRLPTPNDVLWIGLISLSAMLVSIIVVEFIKKGLKTNGRLERLWLLFLINILMVLTLFFFAITKQFIITSCLYVTFYTVRKINQPIYKALMNEYIPSEIRATTISTFGIIDSIGQIIGGPIIGLIALKTSIAKGIITSSIMLIPVIFIYLSFIRKIIKKPSM